MLRFILAGAYLFSNSFAGPPVTLKVSDIKVVTGLVANCLDVSVDDVQQPMSDRATVRIRLRLKAPMSDCLTTINHTVAAVALDSAKNELDSSLLSPPNEVGTKKQDTLILKLPTDFTPPVTITLKKYP